MNSERFGSNYWRSISVRRAERDFSTIYDTLLGRAGEPGLVAKIAREFGVSRSWLYRNVIPALEREEAWRIARGVPTI